MKKLLGVFTDGNDKGRLAIYLGATPYLFNTKVVTHNEAEYLAIIKAIKLVKPRDEIEIFLDNPLILNEIYRKWPFLNNRHKELYFTIKKLLAIKQIKAKFKYCSRDKNVASKLLDKGIKLLEIN